MSSSWYGPAPAVQTWNFIVAHLHGVPEILTPSENLDVLGQLVDHCEARPTDPQPLHRTDALSRGTVGFRVTPTRIAAKQNMSQNKGPEIVGTIMTELQGYGYADPSLAREMRLARPNT
jgi:transcriptional regulator